MSAPPMISRTSRRQPLNHADMDAKQFSEELGDLMGRAADGVVTGKMSFAQVIGTIEMAKMDMHRFAVDVVERQNAKVEQPPLILIPK